MPLPDGVRAVLLDIEGTTTPLAFVEEVLFPYARERLEEAVARAGEDPQVAAAIGRLRAEHEAERRQGGANDLPDFGDGGPYARYLMAADRKSTGLKELQGLLWRRGYEDGSLEAQVFPDVPEALARWRRDGVRVRIYSSGSVLAQKLLFAHTGRGDLTPWLEDFHDTRTGPKKEPESYRRIAAAMDLPPEAILFLSDSVEELDAARSAGLRTGLAVRPGNRPAPANRHPRFGSLAELS
jgi:enolase-phosphatase E1